MKRLIVLLSLVFVFLLSSVASAPIKRELERGKNYIKFGVKLSNNLIYFQNVITLGAIDPTETIQPENGKDSEMISTHPNTNYGSWESMGSGSVARTIIEFDLSSIPSNADITSAVMSLYNYYTSMTAGNVAAYRIKVDWVESEVTWNVRKSGVSWDTAGCDGENDRESTYIAQEYISSTGWNDFDLDADAVEEWINGSFSNNGMLLKRTDTSALIYWRSSDYGGSSTDPKITITYTLPSAGGKMMEIM